MKRKFIISGVITAVLLTVAFVFFAFQKNDTMTASNISQKSYVALGDSVAAGIGLPTASDPSACGRSDESYSSQFAKKASYSLTNVACSGATIASGINGSQTVNQLVVPSQLDQLFKLETPALITMTVGANDIEWEDVLRQCYQSQCVTAQNKQLLEQRLDSLETNLMVVLETIQKQYGDETPQLVLVGYYQLFETELTTNCIDTTSLDLGEIQFGKKLLTDINSRLKLAVSDYEFASYSAPDFTGHELCSQNSYVQGLNDKAPYHPSELGQSAYAVALYSDINAIRK